MLVDRRIRTVHDPGDPKRTDLDSPMDPEYCSGLSEKYVAELDEKIQLN
jgi:hypothetical protein